MKRLLVLGFIFSLPALAEIKERYEIKFNQSLAYTKNSYSIIIQDGKVIEEETLNKKHNYCEISLGYGDIINADDGAILFDRPSIWETEQGNIRHMFHPRDFKSSLRSLDCYLTVEEVSVEAINEVMGPIAQIKPSEQILVEDLEDKKLRSACEHKVLDYYSGIYHRTFKAASNTFLNNFIGRKNTWAHALGAPRIAFLQLSWTTNNYIADRIVEKSKKSKEEVYEKYMMLLRTGKLCKDMQKDYKKPRKVRKYLLEQLKQS